MVTWNCFFSNVKLILLCVLKRMVNILMVLPTAAHISYDLRFASRINVLTFLIQTKSL